MHLLIKLIAIGTIISLPLVGCTSQKDVSNNIEDNNNKIQISDIITENENENTYSEEKAEESEQDNERTETEVFHNTVTFSDKEASKKDTAKDTIVSKDAYQPVPQNNTLTNNNPSNQEILKPSTINKPDIQDDEKVVKEDPKQQPSSETKVFQTLIHKGSAMGLDGMIDVAVTVVDGKINSIEVLSHEDTPSIALNAFELLTSTIVSSQKLDIDAVSGATYSSEGFLKAVKKALAK